MASMFSASASNSSSSEWVATDENLLKSESYSKRMNRRRKLGTHNVFSIPSFASYRHLQSSTFPSRWFDKDFNGCNRSRSLRSISGSSRSFIPRKNNLRRVASMMKTMSRSFDSKLKSEEEKILSCACEFGSNMRDLSDTNLLEDSLDEFPVPEVHGLDVSTTQAANRVGRSVSSPEGLHPVNNTHGLASPNWIHSNLTSEQLFESSGNIMNNREMSGITSNISGNTSITDHLQSLTYLDENQDISPSISPRRSSRSSVGSVLPQSSSTFGPGLYSSRARFENESNASRDSQEMPYVQRPLVHSLHWSLAGDSSRISELENEESPRLSQLAFAHLASHDLSSMHFQSPPPSYEKLCNVESLPSYHEALQLEKRHQLEAQHRRRMQLMVSPHSSYLDTTATNPLLNHTDRRYSMDIFSSLNDLTDSEFGFSTILDAIPTRQTRDPNTAVPIRFASRWNRYQYNHARKCSWFYSVCNKSLVRKELNARWPFIFRAKEDERCPGLLFIECFASSGMDHQRSTSEPNGIVRPSNQNRFHSESTSVEIHEREFSEPSPDDEENSSQHIMFYLCGKCVAYDSFDAENVRQHIEMQCTGSQDKFMNISEFYLAMRALGYVIIVVLLLFVLSLQHL